MSDSALLKWVTGNRLTSIAGVKMREGAAMRYSGDYRHIDIPLAEAFNPTTEEVVTKAAPNQKLRLIPAVSLDVKGDGYRVLVKVNPLISEVANCPAMFIVDPGQREVPAFTASFHRGMDLTTLDWVVRLYLMG